MVRIGLKRVSFVAVGCLVGVLVFEANAQAKPQPLMKIALGHLRQAKVHHAQGRIQPTKRQLEKAWKVLNKAAWDKGGHRVKAIAIIKKALAASQPADVAALIDQALQEVKAGIAHADAQPTQQPQPLMKLALNHLQHAKGHHDQGQPALTRQRLTQALNVLNKAAWDKGGHRVKAIHFIKQALRATRPARIAELIARATNQVQLGIQFADSH